MLGEKQVEVLLHQNKGEGRWLAFARPARKLKEGMQLAFADDFHATVLGRTDDGQVSLQFDAADMVAKLEVGHELHCHQARL
jgi:S-adenosylmethionine:tRNA ribosyltransferase-isomerase